MSDTVADPSIPGALARQPQNDNLLSPLGFRFSIRRMPYVNWFIQSATIPGVTLGEALHPTPFLDTAQPGDKLVFDPLSITFKVDENLQNWSELQTWLLGLGSPTNFRQYKEHRAKYGNEAIVSDATLTILNSNMNPNFEITFTDMFPLTVGELQLDTTAADVDYVTASATFKYLNYTTKKL